MTFSEIKHFSDKFPSLRGKVWVGWESIEGEGFNRFEDGHLESTGKSISVGRGLSTDDVWEHCLDKQRVRDTINKLSPGQVSINRFELLKELNL